VQCARSKFQLARPFQEGLQMFSKLFFRHLFVKYIPKHGDQNPDKALIRCFFRTTTALLEVESRRRRNSIESPNSCLHSFLYTTQQLPRVLSTEISYYLYCTVLTSTSTYVPVQTSVSQEQLHCTYILDTLSHSSSLVSNESFGGIL